MPFLVLDLKQNAGYSGEPAPIAGALLRGSAVWILAPGCGARPATPEEFLVIQGCVDACDPSKPPAVVRAFRAGRVTAPQVINLAGNGFHEVAFGSVLVHVLANFCRKQDSTESSSESSSD
eukprot:5158933-Alexandrium_andersonii.AAC.1